MILLHFSFSIPTERVAEVNAALAQLNEQGVTEQDAYLVPGMRFEIDPKTGLVVETPVYDVRGIGLSGQEGQIGDALARFGNVGDRLMFFEEMPPLGIL